MAQLDSAAEEVSRLRRCLNDLLGVTALPALWTGVDPAQIVDTLVDALFEVLRVGFVFVRLRDPDGGGGYRDVSRIGALRAEVGSAHAIGAALEAVLGDAIEEWPANARLQIGESDLGIAAAGLGLQREFGIVVIGHRRAGFPEQADRLLLDVATSQAVVGLQQARFLGEQQRLAAARESRLIVDNIPGLVALLSATGEVEVVNRQLLEYFGQTVEELRYWGTNDTVHREDQPHVADVFTRAIATGTPYRILQRFRRVDGVYRWFTNSGAPLLDAMGRVERWCVLLTDIDEQRHAEDALNRARSELAHVSRATALSALSASVAHEVNQPLSGIITNASTTLRMLDAEPPNIAGARDAVRRTIRDGNRAAAVTSRLRAMFSRSAVTREPLDLNEAMREVIALSLSDLRRSHVILRSELDPALPLVFGDRIQLQQVIQNLLRNGAEAMHDVHDRPRRLLIRSKRETDDRIRVVVRDSGVGLPAQDADAIFDTFYTTKSGGMGIGLSISRSIVEQHHGKLWAEPNNGPGATFTLSIPCRPADAADDTIVQLSRPRQRSYLSLDG